MQARTRPALFASIVAATVTMLAVGGTVLATTQGRQAASQQAPAEPARQIIGGGELLQGSERTGSLYDVYLGLFGYMSDSVRGWSRLPAGGTLASFSGAISRLPAGNSAELRDKNAWSRFTVMCKAPGGSASSCGGLGPGPVETPVSCLIRQLAYSDISTARDRIVPYCTDGTKPNSFEFSAGEWITIHYQSSESPSFLRGQWSATYAPGP